MKRQEIYEYYSVLNASSRLIDLDTSYDIEAVKERLMKVPKDSIGTYHIEIFNEDELIQSYSLAEIYSENKDAEPIYNLWENKSSKMKNATMKELAQYIIDNFPKEVMHPFTSYVYGKNEDGTYEIKLLSSNQRLEDIKPDELTVDKAKSILGCLIKGSSIEIHPLNNSDTSDFLPIIEKIKNPRIKLFASTYIRLIPDYIFTAPMNDSGDDRPASDLEDGGIKRHIINMCNLMLKLAKLKYYEIKFTSDEIDKMLVACLFHNFLKSGWQEEYESNSKTKVDYPKTVAKAVKGMQGILPYKDLEFIANLIETHLGDLSPDGVIVPDAETQLMPDTEYKHFIHMAYALTADKDINMICSDNKLYAFEEQDIVRVQNKIPIDDNDIVLMENSMKMDIEQAQKEALNIHRQASSIKDTWAELIKSKKCTKKQLKYIELARNMQFM